MRRILYCCLTAKLAKRKNALSQEVASKHQQPLLSWRGDVVLLRSNCIELFEGRWRILKAPIFTSLSLSTTEETHDDDDTLIIPLQKETCAAAILWRYFLASVWKNLLSTCSAKLPREPSLFLPRTRLNECLMPRVVPPHEQHNATACVTERPGIFLLTRFTQWAVGNIACYWRLLIESICCCCQE